jgi:hypothetical protein
LSFLAPATTNAADSATKCEVGKLKESSRYAACRLKAEATAVSKGASADYTKCEIRFGTRWTKIEQKAGSGICPSEGDVMSMDERITTDAAEIATLLAGGFVLPTSQGPATGQTTSYGAGDDAHQDNGDGTITDLNTGLMWEKKIKLDNFQVDCSATEAGSCADPHDADNVYDWSANSPNYDGGVVTVFLEQLNNRCNDDTTVSCVQDADCSVPGGPCGFAGYRDWRLPSIKELFGVLDFGSYNPSIASAFHGASCGPGCTDLADPACSCTKSFNYWSSSTFGNFPNEAWFVVFFNGELYTQSKTTTGFVRAVRDAF